MLKRLDHFNISTSDMAATLGFFENMFGLVARAAPGQDPAHNSWLCDHSGHPVVHVNLRQGTGTSGPIHHAAFACEGYDALRSRLAGAGHELTEIDNRAISGLRQIFVRSPEGALIELNFTGD